MKPISYDEASRAREKAKSVLERIGSLGYVGVREESYGYAIIAAWTYQQPPDAPSNFDGVPVIHLRYGDVWTDDEE